MRKKVHRNAPRRNRRIMVLIKTPFSSSTRYRLPFRALNPSNPPAIYSRVTTLYFLPPCSFLIGSRSSSVRSSCPIARSSASSVSQIPRTRCPGGFLLSHSTRKPDMIGKRLSRMSIGCVLSYEVKLPFLSWPFSDRGLECVPDGLSV